MNLNADRQRRLLAVFEETMLQAPLAREAYVDRACGDDSELRSDVMRLLALDQEMGSFLEHPTNLLRSAAADDEQFPGTDRFRVLRRLGAGGMGVVYEVDDNVRNEIVALKTHVLVQKRTTDPPAPAAVLPDVPADLSLVCMGLLHRSPAQRFSGHAALHLLARDAPSPVLRTAPTEVRNTAFIGRNRQLHDLNDACLSVVKGSAATVSIHGESGMGKSALVRRFLSQFDARHDVVVVSGRRYEIESVPFKALLQTFK